MLRQFLSDGDLHRLALQSLPHLLDHLFMFPSTNHPAKPVVGAPAPERTSGARIGPVDPHHSSSSVRICPPESHLVLCGARVRVILGAVDESVIVKGRLRNARVSVPPSILLFRYV